MLEGKHENDATPSGARYHPLIVVLLAVSGGIVLDRYDPRAFSFWWVAAGVTWIAWLVLWRRKRDRPAALLLLACVLATGAAWHHACWRLFDADDLGHFAAVEAQPACVEVVALDRPRRIPAPRHDPMRTIPVGDYSLLEVRAVAIRNGRAWYPIHGSASLRTEGHLLGVEAGDRLRVFASLAKLAPARNPGEYDFAADHRAGRRLSRLHAPHPDCIRVVARTEGWSTLRAFGNLRRMGDDFLSRRLTRSSAALASAVLLGERSALPFERTESFFTTGTIHLLVVSGLHVGVLASCLVFAGQLGFLPRRTALALVVALVLAYTILTGARPPVVRAAVVITVFCLAAILGRRVLRFNSLAAAALFILALNPADLFRVGTQLSFLAVAALMAMAQYWLNRPPPDPLDRLIAMTRPWPTRVARSFAKWYWRVTLAGVLVFVVTSPLIMARFHLFSPATLVLSPLLFFPLAIALMSGFAALAVGWLAPPLAAPFSLACDSSLAMMQAAVDFSHTVVGSHFWVPGPPDWWLLVFYAGLAITSLPRVRPPLRWRLALLAAWIAVGIVPSLAKQGDDHLRCTFIAVGHGCSILVELPGDQTLLYDAGSLGSPYAGGRTIAAALWSRGLTGIDAVVISHADADHYNALPTLLERFHVGAVYVSPVMFEEPTQALAELREAIESAGVPIKQVWRGDRLATRGKTAIDVLSPPQTGMLGSDNANSIVLAIEFAGRKILLPGDLESPGLDELMQEPAYDCDVLLAPHHGSRRSDPPGFAAWCTPDVLVISGGDRRDLNLVRGAYEQVGARVLHTAEVGAVTVEVLDGQLDVNGFGK